MTYEEQLEKTIERLENQLCDAEEQIRQFEQAQQSNLNPAEVNRRVCDAAASWAVNRPRRKVRVNMETTYPGDGNPPESVWRFTVDYLGAISSVKVTHLSFVSFRLGIEGLTIETLNYCDDAAKHHAQTTGEA